MKIVMTSYFNDGKKINLTPGMVIDTSDANCPIDEAEARGILAINGARNQTADELKTDSSAAAFAEFNRLHPAPNAAPTK